jgi:hypothetical protein
MMIEAGQGRCRCMPAGHHHVREQLERADAPHPIDRATKPAAPTRVGPGAWATAHQPDWPRVWEPAWRGSGQPEAGPAGAPAGQARSRPSCGGAAQALSFLLFFTVSSISFDPWHLSLIREVSRACKLEDFAIPGVISPSLCSKLQ